VHVSFYDASNGNLLTGATPGRIVDDEFQDSLKATLRDGQGNVVVMAARKGRAGTYTLSALRPGYEVFQQQGIVVQSGSVA
jgi:hypothetical protein